MSSEAEWRGKFRRYELWNREGSRTFCVNVPTGKEQKTDGKPSVTEAQ